MISTRPAVRTAHQTPADRGPLQAAVPRSAHLVGIGGAGMKALAELLLDLGCRLTGSDSQPASPIVQAMRRRGLRVHAGHGQEFLPHEVEALVYSAAVPHDNPERRLARRTGVPEFSYSQMLGRLTQARRTVAVAGTHGKSSTTAMLAWTLQSAGTSPSAVVGAELCQTGRNGWAGESDLLVVEACEYRRSFLELRPQMAVILGIEADHFDCFRNEGELCDAYRAFAAGIPPQGRLLVRGDCRLSRRCAEWSAAPVLLFGEGTGHDWSVERAHRTWDGWRYRVYRHGDFYAEVVLRVPGRHNALNALAAIALGHELGLPPEAVREGLYAFGGIRRRLEPVGSWRGTTLLDDYAHHPTEVRTALRSVREKFGPRRVVCVFQPHQASRTRELFDDFAGSFENADRVLLAPVYAAREAETEATRALSGQLAEAVSAHGVPCGWEASLDRILTRLEDEAQPGDVVVTMGAGDIDRVHHELSRGIRRHRPA